MPNSRLRTALAESMRDIYWAERKLVDTLPKLAEAAQDAELIYYRRDPALGAQKLAR